MAIVDLGGSLAVASRGLFATGVSTDLNGKLKTRPGVVTIRGVTL
jgi:acyl-coenzyme A thioesterase 13